MARFPWPFRRSIDVPESVVDPQPPAEAEPTVDRAPDPQPQSPSDATQEHNLAVDGDFATAFRGRADARTGAPLLGPWGGLGDTARFVVEASHLSESFATQRWVDSSAPPSTMIEDPSEFAAGLPSFASLTNPFAVGGGSDPIFADSLPAAAGTDTFREPPSRAVPVHMAPASDRRAARGSVQPATPTRAPLTVARRVAEPLRRLPATTAAVPGKSPLRESRPNSESRTQAGEIRRETGRVETMDATDSLVSEAAGASPVAEFAGEPGRERSVDAAIQAQVVESMALPLATARRLTAEQGVGSATAVARVGRRVSGPGTGGTVSSEPALSTAPPGDGRARKPGEPAAPAPGTAAVERMESEDSFAPPPIAETQVADVSEAIERIETGPAERPAAGVQGLELPVARLVSEAGDEAPPVSDQQAQGRDGPIPSMGTPLAGGAPRRFTVGEPYEGTLPLGMSGEGRVTEGRRVVDRAGAEIGARRIVETRGGVQAGERRVDGSGRPALPGATVSASGGVPVPLVVGRMVEPMGRIAEPASETQLQDAGDVWPVTGLVAETGHEGIVTESGDMPLVRGTPASEAAVQGFAGRPPGKPIRRGGSEGAAEAAATRGSASRESMATTAGGDGSPASVALFASAAAEPIREAASWEIDTTGLQRTADPSAPRQPGFDLPASPVRGPAAAVATPAAQRAVSLPLGPGSQTSGPAGYSFGGFDARGNESGGARGPGAFGTISVTPSVASRTVSTGGGGSVSREAESAETVTTQSTTTGADSETDQAPMEQDIDSLAEKVWQRVRTKLLHERERRRGLP